MQSSLAPLPPPPGLYFPSERRAPSGFSYVKGKPSPKDHEEWEDPDRWVRESELVAALEEARATIPERFRFLAETVSKTVVPNFESAKRWETDALIEAYHSSRSFTSPAAKEGKLAEEAFARACGHALDTEYIPLRPTRSQNLFQHIDVILQPRMEPFGSGERRPPIRIDVKGYRSVLCKLQDRLIVVERKCARNRQMSDAWNGWLHASHLDIVACKVRLGGSSTYPSFVLLDRERLLAWSLRTIDWSKCEDSMSWNREPVPYQPVTRINNRYDGKTRADLFAYVPLVEAVRASGVGLVRDIRPSCEQVKDIVDAHQVSDERPTGVSGSPSRPNPDSPRRHEDVLHRGKRCRLADV